MKEEFINFVRKNPILIKYVKSGEMTWQKFYEIYNLYNTDYDAWKEYLIPKTEKKEETATAAVDLLGLIKGIDLDKVQEGVQSLQRVFGVFTDMSTKGASSTKQNYKPRPIYKHFDD